MEENFVIYEQALALKELGFDEPCFGFFTHEGKIRGYTNWDKKLNDLQSVKNSSITLGNKWCTSPLKQQVFRWFTSRYNLASYCLQTNLDGRSYYSIKKLETDDVIKSYSGFEDSYEKAENECINILIQYIKLYFNISK